MTATELISAARQWAEPHDLAVGAVVNPFAVDQDRELRLLERKVLAGAEYVQSQMVFDVDVLAAFLERAADLLHGVRFYAGIALLRDEQMANRARRLPGTLVSDAAVRRIAAGGGIEFAHELALQLAEMPAVDALHIFPLGAEAATRPIAAAFRTARGAGVRTR
jgi:5,10-methylenetetrahydrofolate reductase